MSDLRAWEYGVRVEMLRPQRFVWVLTTRINDNVADLAESAVTYLDPHAAFAAGNAALVQMLTARLQPGSS